MQLILRANGETGRHPTLGDALIAVVSSVEQAQRILLAYERAVGCPMADAIVVNGAGQIVATLRLP